MDSDSLTIRMNAVELKGEDKHNIYVKINKNKHLLVQCTCMYEYA